MYIILYAFSIIFFMGEHTSLQEGHILKLFSAYLYTEQHYKVLHYFIVVMLKFSNYFVECGKITYL